MSIPRWASRSSGSFLRVMEAKQPSQCMQPFHPDGWITGGQRGDKREPARDGAAAALHGLAHPRVCLLLGVRPGDPGPVACPVLVIDTQVNPCHSGTFCRRVRNKSSPSGP
ncbi:hypothetical protein EYF80_013385 [Liparis tanakae]|uniref:Uncharacterized protein n=1 Tax=Liparis tanakae TaxID=230148 RepID=A0A4Z2IEG1_9TELE|nr:hypothetical protein EYF80_013385 [Liparis tanakae]